MRFLCLAFVAANVALTACGFASANSEPSPNSVADVKHAFAAHGLTLSQRFANNKKTRQKLRRLHIAAEFASSGPNAQLNLVLELVVVYDDAHYAKQGMASASKTGFYRTGQIGNVTVSFEPAGRGATQVRAAIGALRSA